MSVCLLVMTDGRRDCLTETVFSALRNVHGDIARKIIHDDSGDPDHRQWLAHTFGPQGFQIAFHSDGRRGFGGAIRNVWRLLQADPVDYRHVFHLEDDFTFNQPVNLWDMVDVLDHHPHLVQLALRRQPWNDDERAAGGIVEQHPDDFSEVTDGVRSWLEHRRFFTTNPSLYRRALTRARWPHGANSEGKFTHQLLVSPKVRFGYWGARDSGEWVRHIGNQRIGVGY